MEGIKKQGPLNQHEKALYDLTETEVAFTETTQLCSWSSVFTFSHFMGLLS